MYMKMEKRRRENRHGEYGEKEGEMREKVSSFYFVAVGS